MSKKTSMADVAKLAGVTSATVSRVINNNSAISDETRQKVLQAVSDLNYSPSVSARNLRAGGDDSSYRKNTIALIMPWGTFHCSNYGDEYRSRFIFSCVREAVLNHFHLIVHGYRKEQEGILPSPVMQQKVEGVIGRFADLETIDAITNQVPCILLDQHIPSPPTKAIQVLTDISLGIGKVMSHLVELGHSRIAFLRCYDNSRRGPVLWHSYFECMEMNNLDVPGISMKKHDITLDQINQTVENVLPTLIAEVKAGRVTALLCPQDVYAIRVIEGLRKAGLQVPEDISIVGFDDDRLFMARGVPELTTVRIPIDEISKTAMSLMINIKNGAVPNEHRKVLIDPTLIVRASTGKPKEI